MLVTNKCVVRQRIDCEIKLKLYVLHVIAAVSCSITVRALNLVTNSCYLLSQVGPEVAL